MSLHLYEVAALLVPLLESGIDEDGVMSPDLVHAIEKFDGAGKAIVGYALNLEAEAEACKAALARITARKRSLENKSKSLRDYLAANMRVTGITRIDAADGSWSARLYPDRDESVEVAEGTVLPPAFQRVKVEPDKTALKAAIKNGEPVPEGVRLVRRDRLTIS